jgi:hypothetical protein
MKIYFTISEFCIARSNIPQYIADAILKFFIIPLSLVRGLYGAPVYVSRKSGWRPVTWEQQKGRKGDSQHCFIDRWEEGLGAVDLKGNDLPKLLELLIKYTKFTRICYYPKLGFIHCDYKPDRRGKRVLFIYSGSKWNFKEVIKKY